MPNSYALVIDKLDHYQFVNYEFSVKAHLVDTRTNTLKLGEKLQLKVLIMFEELSSDASAYKEYHPNLIEIVRNDGIRAEDGMADIRVKLKEVSMANDDRRFVICVQAYQSGAGNNLITAQSNPITCIRHKLVVFEDPTSKNKLLLNDDGQGGFMWYKDEGAKDKCIEMVVQLVDCFGNLVVDRIVPLHVSLTYSSGQLVQPQGVLALIPERNIFIGVTGYEVVRFRVNEVSRNHRKQNFQIFVGPDVSSSPITADISPACSVDFEVKSKRTADARNKSQASQAFSGAEYPPVLYQKMDEDSYAAPSLPSEPYLYVKSDTSIVTHSVPMPSASMAAADALYANKRLKVPGGMIPTGLSTSLPSSSSSSAMLPDTLLPSRYHLPGDLGSSASAAPVPPATANSSYLTGGDDLSSSYYSLGSVPAPASAPIMPTLSSAKGPSLQYAPYPAVDLKAPARYPRVEDTMPSVDHTLWNEQCSGFAVEASQEVEAWSKSVMQLVDDILSSPSSASNAALCDAAMKIKMKYAADIVSCLGCLHSYTSYQHHYNCNHSKLLQNLQYQFPGSSVGSGVSSLLYGSYPTASAAVGLTVNTSVGGSAGSGVGLTGSSTALPPSLYRPVIVKPVSPPADDKMVQAILVMKSVVVRLHDELDSTTDVGVPAFDCSFSLVGFYKVADNNYMLFRKSDKIEALLTEMQKSQIKAELLEAIKSKSKFLFDVSSYGSLSEMKNAALAAVIAKTKAERDLIDAVSLMENLRKPYLG